MRFRTFETPHLPEPYFLSIEERREVQEALKTTDLDEETRSLYKEMLYIRAKPDLSEKEKETIANYYAIKTKNYLKDIEARR